jgi:hypothetical protein
MELCWFSAIHVVEWTVRTRAESPAVIRSTKMDNVPFLKVTFDTNALTGAVTPDLCIPHTDHAACVAVHEALKSGHITGYFSEAVVTLDVLGKEDKVAVVGGARIESESSSKGPSTFTISIGTRWPKTGINQISLDLVRTAQSLGMKALIGPRHLGNSLSVHGFGETFYENLLFPADLERASKTNEVDAALAQRGLGRTRAVELGVEYSKRDDSSGECWMQGLGRARNDTERRGAHRAINEWADGDAIAAHIGYGNDLFCTHDKGGRSRQRSSLHPSHRAWLRSGYGVEFVTLSGLADRLAP